MTLKNPAKWIAPSGTGFLSRSGGLGLTTLSGKQLTTLSGVSLTTDELVYSQKSLNSWTPTEKNQSQWIPRGGQGYVLNAGSIFLTDNLGNFIVDNSGNNLVTTPIYTIPKNPTLWSESGV